MRKKHVCRDSKMCCCCCCCCRFCCGAPTTDGKIHAPVLHDASQIVYCRYLGRASLLPITSIMNFRDTGVPGTIERESSTTFTRNNSNRNKSPHKSQACDILQSRFTAVMTASFTTTSNLVDLETHAAEQELRDSCSRTRAPRLMQQNNSSETHACTWYSCTSC